MSNPTKLTPEVAKKILTAIANYSTKAAAAEAAGVSPRLLNAWLEQGEREPDGYFGVFRRKFLEVRGKSEGGALKEIRVGKFAGEPDWKARSEWLRLTNPERYAPTVQIRTKVDMELQDAIDRLRAGLPRDQFLTVLKIIAGPVAALAEGTPSAGGSGDAAAGDAPKH